MEDIFATKLDELITEHWNLEEAEEIISALELKLMELKEQLQDEEGSY
jgi:hypothetical protein